MRKGPWPRAAQKAIQYTNKLAWSDCVAGTMLHWVTSIAASSSEPKASWESSGTYAKICLREARIKKGEQLVISKFKASQERVGHFVCL